MNNNNVRNKRRESSSSEDEENDKTSNEAAPSSFDSIKNENNNYNNNEDNNKIKIYNNEETPNKNDKSSERNKRRDKSIFDDDDEEEEEENEDNDNNLNKPDNNNQNKGIKLYDYQKEIFQKVKEKPNNSIIFMETGKGKTLIAILLMADILNIDILNSRPNIDNIDTKKKIIFLVCDTSLVVQQQNAIKNYLNIDVGVFQGKKSKKSKNDYKNFRAYFNNYSVFVAIHNVLYKLLSCGFLEIDEINLMVFDECHHCDTDHPYNLIMEEFYFYNKKNYPNKKLPIIIGLTASPSKNAIKNNIKENAEKSLKTLSENLDCKIVIDPEMKKSIVDINNFNDIENINYISVESHVDNKFYKEIVEKLKKIFFDNFTNYCFDYFFEYERKKIKGEFYLVNEKKSNYISLYKKIISYKFNTTNLIFYNQINSNIEDFNLANYSLIFNIYEKIQRNIFLILENLDVFSLQKYFEENIQIYNYLINKKNKENNNNNNDNEFEIEEINKIKLIGLKKFLEFFEIGLKTVKKIIKYSQYISDRIIKMKNELMSILSTDPKSKIVIFVQNRIVAFYLETLLNEYFESINEDFNCVSVIGVNRKRSESGTVINPTNSMKEMNEKLKKFNTGKTQILIGTSAVEEGLDFQSCNSVLVFTQLNTAKSYIQMKGRARMKNKASSFKVFTNDIDTTKNNIQQFIILIKEMKEFFNDDIVHDFREKGFEKSKKIGLYFFDKFKKSSAKITLKNVSMLYNEVLQQAANMNYPIKVKIETEKIKNEHLTPEYIYQSEGIFSDDNKINFNKMKKNVINGRIKGNKHIEKSNSEKEIQMRILVLLYKAGYLSEYIKFQIPNN
jgi:ERCC4-related helicase